MGRPSEVQVCLSVSVPVHACYEVMMLYLKHALMEACAADWNYMLPEGEEDDFIREAATESVRVHPLSLFRCARSIMHRPMSEQKGVAILSGLHSPAP